MLRAAVIGLHPGEFEVRRMDDRLRQRDGRRTGSDAAALSADIDLDQDSNDRAGAQSRRTEIGDRDLIVDRNRHPRLPRQRRQPVELAGADDLVRDEHIRYAAEHHRLGFRNLLAAQADRAQRHLLEADHRRFVGLGMRAKAHAGLGDRIGHADEIALEGIEIDHQRRRVDLRHRHARPGGGKLRHEASPEGCATIAASGTRGNARV